MKRMFRLMMSLLVCILLLQSIPQAFAQPIVSASPTASGIAPEFLNESLFDLRGRAGDAQTWIAGGGYLYWSNCFAAPASIVPNAPQLAATTYLRRWPLSGGSALTLSDVGFCNPNLWAADTSGLYYVLQHGANYNIYRRSTVDPTNAALVYEANSPIVSIALDGGFVYVLRDTILFGYAVYRVPITGGSMGFIGGAGGTSVSNLIAAGDGFYWFADGQLMSMGRDCLGNCIRTLAAENGGQFLTDATLGSVIISGSRHPLWVNGASIRGYRCSFVIGGGSCSNGNGYTAPSDNGDPNNTYRYTPGMLSSDGTFLFWVEEHQRYSPGGGLFPPGFYTTGEGRLMKWRLRSSLVTPDPFDTPQQIACQNCNATYDLRASPTAVANGWVYFSSSRGLSRIRADAPPISWDIAVDGLELTQVIQNMNNDVPMVANKATFARVFGRKLDGPTAMNVRAVLHGSDANGNPLPGSPLQPLNSTQNIMQSNIAMDRSKTASGWLFALPSSWSAAGGATFTAQLDPRGVLNDSNRQNNSRAQAITFTRKAPVCVVAVPVRTSAPAASYNDPGYRRQIDVLRKLYPVSDVWSYHQNDDVAELQARFGIPPWEYGPYELPDDGDKVLQSLWWRDAFSDDPDECDDAGAETHYIGLVHANTPMGNNLGLGRINSAVLYTKLVPASRWGNQDFRDQPFNTLAHELGHNYGRQHINCGSPANTDASYPYNPCMLDSRSLTAASTYFGFEPSLQQVILPNQAQDYMSYGAPYWTSDYTYRALYNRIANRAVQSFAAAGAVIYLSGSVNPGAGTGSLDHAWVFPSNSLSQGMQRKLQQFATTMQLNQVNAQAQSYTIVLFDAAGTELKRETFTPADVADGDPNTAQSFNLAFAAPQAQVARIELRDGSTVLASQQPGNNAPTISILAPAGGESFDNTMTLSWRASDADTSDKLLYTVQYTPDNGRTWQALLTNLPNPGTGDTVSINLRDISDLPASTNTGQIRVAVSDGYNTTLATSQAFSVANHAPEVYISTPASASSFPAGQSVVLQGSAMDIEDGSIGDAALSWTVDGIAIGNGQTAIAAGLAPGNHTASLTARDANGLESSASVNFTIEALAIPLATAPGLDGQCNDTVYEAGSILALQPYADGTQASVQLVRSETDLWLCFSGLKRANGNFASLRIDANNSREATIQADDIEYGFTQDGAVFVRHGSGGREAPAVGSVDSRVNADDNGWSVEARISADTLGGWNHVIGLMLDHNWVHFQGDDYHWPSTSVWNQPSSWASTMLGVMPHLDQVSPNNAAAGSPGILLTLTGSAFQPDATALWNGAARPSTFVSATELQVMVSASDLNAVGTASISVVNSNSIGAASNTLPFFISTKQQEVGSSGWVIFLPAVVK